MMTSFNYKYQTLNRNLELLCQLSLISTWNNTRGAAEVWDSFKEIIEWIEGQPYFYSKYYPQEFAPDICYNCFEYFGDTIGGRVRKGCANCQGKWVDIANSTTDRFYHLLQQTFGSNIVEYEMARALYLRRFGNERG